MFWAVEVASGVVLSQPFTMSGLECQLRLQPSSPTPDGRGGETYPCGLYLRCPAGSRVRFRLYAGTAWLEPPLVVEYPKRKDKGLKHVGGFQGKTKFGVEILDLEALPQSRRASAPAFGGQI